MYIGFQIADLFIANNNQILKIQFVEEPLASDNNALCHENCATGTDAAITCPAVADCCGTNYL